MNPSRRHAPTLVATFIAATVAVAGAGCRSDRNPPPVIAPTAPFELVDQRGERFGSGDLAGKVWIANFIFTRCTQICPRFSARMAEVQELTKGFPDRVRLVSFSVDPAYDTPAVLSEYAARFRADPARWTFLTGPAEAIQRAVVEGMKIAVERAPGAKDVGSSILHGGHFVLVDGQGRIRGYYAASDEIAVRDLVRDATTLARRGD